MTYENLLSVLQNNSDKKFDEFNKKITNSGVKTIGCTVPFVRKIAKSVSLQEAIDFPTHEYYEIDLLKGIVISQSKLPFKLKKDYLLEFSETIENWAVCDCSAVKVKKGDNGYFDFFIGMTDSGKEFVCRYGLVNLLSNYLDESHIELIYHQFANITFGRYYVDMAVAWLIATAMVHCRNETKRYMENDARKDLNVFTYNKALQKMRESYRISQDDKDWAKRLKINAKQ